ncbi:hypothetical protein NP233_g1644 [Leucocoprinus birnbaumii]|uniref:Uncharacterized protein n=1 Tax=Leucocoprinus birnbaumii TaxID=56174 RepID=A0AAD5YVL7_9AGAR|nr:hypothetical protein NP233_g1644 [Leucocoprinus birnbaumii]
MRRDGLELEKGVCAPRSVVRSAASHAQKFGFDGAVFYLVALVSLSAVDCADSGHVLLLGQSESGKSTTLKQFQLLYATAAFHSERIAWRAVIYLNLVRSVRRILEALAPELDQLDEHDEFDHGEAETDIVISISSNGRPPSAILDTRVAKYEDYRRRLAPLAELEDRLTRLLAAPDEDEPTHLAPPHPNWDAIRNHYVGDFATGINGRPAPTITIPSKTSSHVARSVSAGGHEHSWAKEVAVRSEDWKRAFQLRLGYKSKSPKTPKSGEIEGWWEDPDDPVHTLHSCAKAMQELWADPQVKRRLQEKRLRLEESSGFYLDEIHRITAKKYIPTDADVLKARLKTTGVVEHTFVINSGHNKGAQWRIYDVGGARGQRQAWAPYFDEVNAIIFLAPISAFDQVLAEDPRINRLEDSLLLWKSLVSNPLLAKVNIILFLNKCDLLQVGRSSFNSSYPRHVFANTISPPSRIAQSKLEAGVRLSHHMYTYGDRPNDYESVSKYFRNKFGALHVSYSRNKERELYIHFTAVTDTRRTATIISSDSRPPNQISYPSALVQILMFARKYHSIQSIGRSIIRPGPYASFSGVRTGVSLGVVDNTGVDVGVSGTGINARIQQPVHYMSTSTLNTSARRREVGSVPMTLSNVEQSAKRSRSCESFGSGLLRAGGRFARRGEALDFGFTGAPTRLSVRTMATKVTTHESLGIVSTAEAPAAIGPYSQAIKVGSLVFCSGCIPLNPETMQIVSGGVEAQAQQALDNLKAVVEASGSELGKVAKVTVFLKNMDDFVTVNGIYANFFGDHKPARSAVEVARLPKDVLVEVEAIASFSDELTSDS